MLKPLVETRSWRSFRRAFLWTLAAFALASSVRAESAPGVPAPSSDAEWVVVVRPREIPQAAPPRLPAPGTQLADVGVTPDVSAPGSATAPAAALDVDRATPVSAAAGATVTEFQDGWKVTIMPRATSAVAVNGLRYDDVYPSIPYRLSEYLANPGYRHEATLEVMFGELRPKTVVSNYTPQTVPVPRFSVYKPYRYSQTELNYLYRPAGFGYSWNFGLSPYYPAYPRYPMLY